MPQLTKLGKLLMLYRIENNIETQERLAHTLMLPVQQVSRLMYKNIQPKDITLAAIIDNTTLSEECVYITVGRIPPSWLAVTENNQHLFIKYMTDVVDAIIDGEFIEIHTW